MDWKRSDPGAWASATPSNWLFPHYYEALDALFRIENALRMLVYVVLKSHRRAKWIDVAVTSDEASETSIGALAKKRIAQHERFAYLGFSIEAPMMHLTSGELVGLLTSDPYWPLFKEFFRATRQVVILKLQEIGDVRNALAHFRPLTEDDVEAVKQNAKQVLSSVEAALLSMVSCTLRVPTNTPAPWYQELRAVGSGLCGLEFHQSTDARWVRVTMRFTARIIAQFPDEPKRYVHYQVLNLDTPQVLEMYDSLRCLTMCLTEKAPKFLMMMPTNFKPSFAKRLEFTFSRPTLETEFAAVLDSFKNLVAEVENEAELIVSDNLAKGRLVHLSSVGAHKETEREWWQFDTTDLQRPVESHHPPEYWGSITFPWKDLISDSDQFPWMRVPVSREQVPF